jgi:serine/threonine protein kinase
LAADKSITRAVKEMSKSQILARGENTTNLLIAERQLLTGQIGKFCRLTTEDLEACPFVVKLYAATQDEQHLYLMLDFCSGGELDFHLTTLGSMPEGHVKFYAAELIVALEEMHTKHKIVHRYVWRESAF